MSDDRLRRRIQSVTPPGELQAERRAWAVVRAAFEEREPTRRAWRPRWAFLVPAVALAAAVGLAATPAGPAVVDAVREVFQSEDARPGLRSLPAPGRLLVRSDEGLWVVRRDGSKRRLGDYGAGSWSPNGKFVVATDARHVVALEPDTGDPRWSLTRAQVADARWMPGSGTRVAYRAGSNLRVVVGNGTDDRLLARDVARTPPAWRPGHEMQLAFADRRGVVRLVDVDTRRVLWRSRLGEIVALAWSADGSRLAAVTAEKVRVLTGGGRPAATLAVPAGTRAAAAAYAPRGRMLALLRRTEAASEVVLVNGRRQRLLTRSPGRLADPTWSPDGRLLLVGWASADEWLFLPVGGGRPTAVGEIAAEFAPGAGALAAYPQIEGWVSSP